MLTCRLLVSIPWVLVLLLTLPRICLYQLYPQIYASPALPWGVSFGVMSSTHSWSLCFHSDLCRREQKQGY